MWFLKHEGQAFLARLSAEHHLLVRADDRKYQLFLHGGSGPTQQQAVVKSLNDKIATHALTQNFRNLNLQCLNLPSLNIPLLNCVICEQPAEGRMTTQCGKLLQKF